MYYKRVLKLYNKLYRYLTRLDYDRIGDVRVGGVDFSDYPDFCDAFIEEATYKGRYMTDAELARLNEDSDFVYSAVEDSIY